MTRLQEKSCIECELMLRELKKNSVKMQDEKVCLQFRLFRARKFEKIQVRNFFAKN